MKRRNPLYVAIGIAVVLLIVTVLIVMASGYRYTSDDGIKFIGKTVNGQPYNGIVTFTDGSTARIDIANRTIEYDNKDVYVGDISGVKRNGIGVMTFYASGDVYEGSFVEDRLEGYGKMIYDNGDMYEGTMIAGKKHGKGKFTFANGNSYDGEYENDVMTGNGTFRWNSGAYYVGAFDGDVKHGIGTMYFADGSIYTGDFDRDMRNGKGTYTWPDGTVYTGLFRNNLMDTRKVDENGNFIKNKDGSYQHQEPASYTTQTESGTRTRTLYFEEGKIVAVENP